MYLVETRWLRDHGLIASWAEYDSLPHGILEDARLMMAAEAQGRAIANA